MEDGELKNLRLKLFDFRDLYPEDRFVDVVVEEHSPEGFSTQRFELIRNSCDGPAISLHCSLLLTSLTYP